MIFPRLQNFTSARVSLGRAGHSLPTDQLLNLQAAHARARQAVHSKLDIISVARDIGSLASDVLLLRTAAPDRATYLRRPDLGRQLHPESSRLLTGRRASYDVAFVLADGLSALALERHASPVLHACLPRLSRDEWNIAPLTIVEQGRVAIGDQIGHLLGASLVVVLIGERPGLSSFDSLGLYLTWKPEPGMTDAGRNCISNVRAEGLSYTTAAHRLLYLMSESRRRKLSGVALKEDAGRLALSSDRPAVL